jgi:hypothetical protein
MDERRVLGAARLDQLLAVHDAISQMDCDRLEAESLRGRGEMPRPIPAASDCAAHLVT